MYLLLWKRSRSNSSRVCLNFKRTEGVRGWEEGGRARSGGGEGGGFEADFMEVGGSFMGVYLNPL